MSENNQKDPFIKVSAVIPCLNEEKTIGLCINKAQKALEKLNIQGEVIVSDNGSGDKSVEIAESLGARVVHAEDKGYGAALKSGIEAAKGEIIIMADGDDSYDWSNLEPFISKIEEGYDLVMGNRFKGGIEPGAMPRLHKYLGNPALSGIAKFVFKTPIGDFHCGMRAFRKAAINNLKLKSTGMEFATEMVANAARHNLRITEIPIKLYPDKRDRSPHLRSFRDGWRHLRFILLYAPDHLFFFPGLLLTFVGFTMLALLVTGPVTVFGFYMGIHFLALACLLSLVGYNILWMSFIAKSIISEKFENMSTRLLSMLRSKNSLEKGLVIGSTMILMGCIIDISIFLEWIRDPNQSMANTVHPAFAATTLIAIGVMTIFYSFLFSLHQEISGKR